MWQNEGGMISAAGVLYIVGKLRAWRFHQGMGRVPSDEKIPDDMSAEGKCTVRYGVYSKVRRKDHAIGLSAEKYRARYLRGYSSRDPSLSGCYSTAS